MTRDEIIQAIHKERERQESLHPHWKGDDHGLAVLVEEVGEIAKALYEWNEFKNRIVVEPDDFEKAVRLTDALESELIQTAAVCFRWLENYDE